MHDPLLKGLPNDDQYFMVRAIDMLKPPTPKARFSRACRREPVDRPPVWMMRQAGRYLPEYRQIRETHSTLEMMKDPKTACAITLQPITRLGVDAAILYSDILIVPEAMGLKLDFVRDVGPTFDRPVTTASAVDDLNESRVPSRCAFVFETVRKIRTAIGPDFPLIGFAGAPFTVAAYMAGGDGAHNGEPLKQLAQKDPGIFRSLMQKLTTATVDYLRAQIESGADAVQLFDTWAGTLSPDDYAKLAAPAVASIFENLRTLGVPMILYVKGGGPLLERMLETGPTVISVDWRTTLSEARRRTGGRVAIQGNLDPAVLLKTPAEIQNAVRAMAADWGTEPGWIVNLGHGILENTPVENAKVFVEAAKNNAAT